MGSPVEAGRIVLTFADDTLEVFAERGEFRGRAAGDHPLIANDLSAFARRLVQFPLSPSELTLAGSGAIELSIRQLNSLGHIELRANLRSFVPEVSVSITIRLDYETVGRLAREIERAIKNGAGKIVLVGNPD